MAATKNQILTALRPGSGVKEDFNAFVHNFVEKNTLRYEDFADLWRELGMPYLFAGRIDTVLKEAVAYSYTCALAIFNSTVNIQTKICSIYLLYAVYQTQSLYPKAKIRVTPAQFVAFCNFVDEMAAKQHYDFVFVFSRLRMERAFLYVATSTAQGKLKKCQVYGHKVKEYLPTSLVSTFSDISLELVEDLSVVNEEYHRVKCVATNPAVTADTTVNPSAPHPSVDLAKPEFIKDITRQLAMFDNWRKTGHLKKKVTKRKTGGATTSESEGDNPSDSDSAMEPQESIAYKRQKLRDKAFGTVSGVYRSSRYRKIVGESKQSSDNAAGPSGYMSNKLPKPKRNPSEKELRELNVTNDYLRTATAPSKKVLRRRRRAQKLASQQASAATVRSSANKGTADTDSDD